MAVVPPDILEKTVMIKIAAVNSSMADKTAADVVCDGVNDQTDITTALGGGDVQVFLFDGTYQIDAPIDMPPNGILIGNSVWGVGLRCNTASGVIRSSAPATKHEHVLVEALFIYPGSADDLALDLRGFTRSQFNRLRIYNFDLGVWFGGNLPTYDSCWTNILRQAYLSQNLVGVKLSGTTAGGVPTPNNIMILESEIICRDASGGIAIDVIDGGELNVESCDIGYGDASDGIVLRAGVKYARIVNNRFEWDAQDSGKYPIHVLEDSYYNFFSGNTYSGGCQLPNMYDENGADARYLQVDDFARSSEFTDGYADFNIDTVFNQYLLSNHAIEVHSDRNSCLLVTDTSNTAVFLVSPASKSVTMPNGGFFSMYSDDFTTKTLQLYGTTGKIELAGDLVGTSDAPSVTAGSFAGTGATASATGSNIGGLLTLTTGTGPGVGKVLGITWANNKPNADYAVVLTPANANAVAAMSKVYVNQAGMTNSTVDINASAALTASTQYKFFYSVICY
jgi:hypothetical protein